MKVPKVILLGTGAVAAAFLLNPEVVAEGNPDLKKSATEIVIVVVGTKMLTSDNSEKDNDAE